MAEKNRGGRPRKHPYGVHRPVMAFRIRQDLYDKLNEMAAPKGYSLSEILSRIVEEHFDGADQRHLIREEIRAALTEREGNWKPFGYGLSGIDAPDQYRY